MDSGKPGTGAVGTTSKAHASKPLRNSKTLPKVSTSSRNGTPALRSSSGRTNADNGTANSSKTRRDSFTGTPRSGVSSSSLSRSASLSTPKINSASSPRAVPTGHDDAKSQLALRKPHSRSASVSESSSRASASRLRRSGDLSSHLSTSRTPPAAKSGSASFSSIRKATSSPLQSSIRNTRPSGRRADNLQKRNATQHVTSRGEQTSVDKSSRIKSTSIESKDSRSSPLPQIEAKADDVRLDLRGHKLRSLDSSVLNLSPKLEFVYLRDNKLASLVGIEILKRLKVLDLSFNEFKGSGFEPLENCKDLQQLYLAGNHITSLNGLPELPNLEFLSVAQNKLKSLAMASQPRLQVLAASKNKISTLKGFPYLPMLEHLRLEENPILDMPHLEAAAILLVGPMLKKFNDKGLSVSEQNLAKKYPSHTAVCIRDGWNFCGPEEAADSTMHFLLEKWKAHLPPGYLVKKASIDPPFVQDACRCHFLFMKDHNIYDERDLTLKFQWFVAEKTPINFRKIEGAVTEVYWPEREQVGKYLKVECTAVLEGIEYLPIFAISSPVAPGTGCPKVISLRVEGDMIEGNLIKGFAEVAWCGGTPARGVASWLRRKWNSSPTVIAGAEEEEYRLTLDDVDCSLVFMYTPVTKEGIRGEPQYAMTDFIKAAFPSVRNVEVFGDLVEGKMIRGVGEYLGGKEGPSKFEWFREDKETGQLVHVSSGCAEYLLTEDDVGCSLIFVYTPINLEGLEGRPSTATTAKISNAPPRVTKLNIIGDLVEGSKVSVSAAVTGGMEGASRIQWFKTNSCDIRQDESVMEAISTSRVAKAFRIPLSAVGYYLVAKYIPVAQDGECGTATLTISNKRVESLPPSLNFLSITGDLKEGEILTASYGYIGGHEGCSEYNWYLHQDENDNGTLIPGAEGHLEYQITKDAVYKFISFKCVPVRDDGVIGEGRSTMSHERIQPAFPMLHSLEILGECIEGGKLTLEKKYFGGGEGLSKIQWFLTRPNGTQHEIKGATTSSYTICKEDIGALIFVSCEPIREDGTKGAIMFSQPVGPVLAGIPHCESLELHGQPVEGGCLSFTSVYTGGERGDCFHEWVRQQSNGRSDKLGNDDVLRLTYEEVGSRIELAFTPVRKDGVVGQSQRVVSDVIAEAEPKGIDLVIPFCCEDEEVVPQTSYHGGIEGAGQYTWFRVDSNLSESELSDALSTTKDIKVLGTSRSYIPTLEDVGSYLALCWVPTRKDGKQGTPLLRRSTLPVSAAPPAVHNVIISEVSPGVFTGKGEYYGGMEGSSQFSWYREKEDGTVVLINGANSKLYKVTEDDYRCRICFSYLPVRSDGVEGELCLSEPSKIILPEMPAVQKLNVTGRAIEGEVLTAIEVVPNCELQENFWDKYKKDARYTWSRLPASGCGESFQPLHIHHSRLYKVRLEDVGFWLHCECVLTDVFGRCSEPVSNKIGPVQPGMPKVEKLEIEGRGFHTSLYAVRGIYSGGKEGKSNIQWLRSMVGSPDLISIPGEVGRMYEANVDDVGYRLVAVYTPVREDGVEGLPVSTSTDVISVEPEVLREVKQRLDLGGAKFEVLRDKDCSPMKQQIQGLGSLERRVLDVSRKRLKLMKPGSKTSFPNTEIRGTYVPPFHVEVFRNDQHRLRIVLDSENEVDLIVQTQRMRDIVVLVIRGLAQRFNSTSLNSLLKM